MESMNEAGTIVDLQGDFFTLLQLEKGPVLGVGMTGEVIATWPRGRPDSKLAVKTFSTVGSNDFKYKKLFEHEVSIMNKINHGYLAKMSLAVRCTEYSVICMELYPGGNLEQRLYKLEDDNIEKYFIQISCALSYLHQKRIVHSDVKLTNIFLDAQDNAVLGDFGICLELPDHQSTIALKDCGGTATYWPPEAKCNGNDNYQVDPFKLDAYALGVVLWAMSLREAPSYIYDYLQEIREAKEPVPSKFRLWIELLLHPDSQERIRVDSLLVILTGESRYEHLVK